MIKVTDISVPLGYNDKILKKYAARKLHCREAEIKTINIIRKSIDARKKDNIRFTVTAVMSLKNEERILQANKGSSKVTEFIPYKYQLPPRKKLSSRPVVVGFGPAGIFASYILSLAGENPIVLERGADADQRTKDIEKFWNKRILNTESNIQFGEGGAGTFSDGKLNTGINDKRIRFVLETFVKFGADEKILTDSRPHVGTDVLRVVVKNIRKEIISLGGEVIFNAKFTDMIQSGSRIKAVKYIKENVEKTIETDICILAAGHSARDTLRMISAKGILLSQKNFSVGVRIEHLQKDINKSLYGRYAENKEIIPASYKHAVHLKNGRTMYTFCMCPGGIVTASSSEEKRIVTNGMSYSGRAGVNANSAILVGIGPGDLKSSDPFAGIHFQEDIESRAFAAGGYSYNAPVIRVGDFLNNEESKEFGKVLPTYPIGTSFASPDRYLPRGITDTLRCGIIETGKKIEGFDDADAILTGVESRSTSPVRIERDGRGEAVGVFGLYPCGEGAGYAGGIMSASVDGIKCAEKIIEK